MKKADWFLVISIALLALIFTAFNKHVFFRAGDVTQETKAVIKVQGEKIKEMSLPLKEKHYKLEVQGKEGIAVIEFQDKQVRMYESPCAEQICVQRSWISSPGESIICVPNEIVVEIESAKQPYDAVTY